MQANKGEWSELYALFSIFSHNKVPAADKDLKPTSKEYIFLSVIRDDTGEKLFYDLTIPNSIIIRDKNGRTLKTLDSSNLPQKSKKIFETIKEHGGSATFAIPLANELMNEYELEKIKSQSSRKTDLDAIVQDNISTEQELGFSIKSQIGNPATLLNASKQTNFIFRVNNFNGNPKCADGSSAEDLGTVRNRLKYIYDNGGHLEYSRINSDTFKSNLIMIDTALPMILSEILLNFYLGNGITVKQLSELDGIGGLFSLDKRSVTYKVKNLLRAVALGMVPSKEWDTYLSTYGGYLIVKEDGTLVCYHLYNDDQFKDYLFNNTKFDTPDSKRHNFGKLYEENGEYYFDLNIQIRFIK